MPKVISNLNAAQDNNKFPSTICKLITENKVSPNQLYCCSENSCFANPDVKNCNPPQAISQCRNISTLESCQRLDFNATRVCEWKTDYFCLTEGSTVDFRSHFFKAIQWMVSRNTLIESINNTNPSGEVTACYNGTDYQITTNGSGCSSDGNVTCGDLFAKEYVCNWKNATTGESINRQPLGEVCEAFVTTMLTTSTLTITSLTTTLLPTQTINSGYHSDLEIRGLSSGLAVTSFLMILTSFSIVSKILKGKWLWWWC